MTCLPFSWVDRQGEGEGGEFGRRERLTRYCWGSRMCKEQSKRMQLKAEEVTSCLNHCGISESLCRDTRLFSFSCCYLFFFFKGTNLLAHNLFWIKNTDFHCQPIACKQSCINCHLFLSRYLSVWKIQQLQGTLFLKLPRGQKVRVMGLADLETISAHSNIRKSPDSQAGAGALSSLRQVQGGWGNCGVHTHPNPAQ